MTTAKKSWNGSTKLWASHAGAGRGAGQHGAGRDRRPHALGHELQRGLHVLDLDPGLDHHARLLSPRGELAPGRIVEAVADVVEDQRRRGHLGDRHRTLPRLAGHIDDLVTEQGLDVEQRVVDGQHDQAGLELAVLHGAGDVERVLPAQAQAHIGMCGAETGGEVGDPVVGGVAERAHGDLLLARRVAVPDRGQGVVGRLGHALGPGQERPARRGQRQAAARPGEQRDAELTLEPAHLF